jgi:hypothetical protein
VIYLLRYGVNRDRRNASGRKTGVEHKNDKAQIEFDPLDQGNYPRVRELIYKKYPDWSISRWCAE